MPNDHLIWIDSTKKYNKTCSRCDKRLLMAALADHSGWVALDADAISLQTRGRASLEWAYGEEDKHKCQ